jgi:hypothetical protein
VGLQNKNSYKLCNLSGLAEVEFVKVMHLGTAKEMWDKCISSYEGNEKVKDTKLQTYRV